MLLAYILSAATAAGLAASCEAVKGILTEAEHALKAGQLDGADDLLTPLRSSAAECPQVLLLLGRTKAAEGMPTLARDLLSEFVQRAPSDPAGYVALAAVMFQQRDLEGVSQATTAALKLDPGNAEALLLQARLLMVKGEDSSAEATLLDASRRHPENAKVQFELGEYFDRHHRSREAVETFQKVVALNPDNSSAWDYLGLNLEAEGDPVRAESAYRSGLAIRNPTSPDSFLGYNFGRLLMKANRFSESETYLTKAVQDLPRVRAVFYERAKLYNLIGKYPAARSDAENALQLPDQGNFIQAAQIYSLLAAICQHLGDTDQSRTYAALARTTKLQGESGGRH